MAILSDESAGCQSPAQSQQAARAPAAITVPDGRYATTRPESRARQRRQPSAVPARRGELFGYNDAGGFGSELAAVDLADAPSSTSACSLWISPRWNSDDPALIVGEHGEREAERSLAELVDGVEAVLLADQHRIVDADFLRVLDHILADVDRDPDDLEALPPCCFCSSRSSGISRRHGAHQVAQKFTIIDLPGQLRIERGVPVEVAEREIGQRGGQGALRRRGLLLRGLRSHGPMAAFPWRSARLR